MHSPRRPRPLPLHRLVLLLGAGLLWMAPSSLPAAGNEPLQWLREYLRFDTTNPPGGEGPAVDYLAGLLHARGHDTRRFVSSDGRVSLLARIEAGKASEPPLLLLHHVDVVPAGEGWTRPPFGAELADGVVWGRGAIDSKSLGLAHLAAFLDAAEHRDALTRDVWFLASADEEAGGGRGVGWILDRHPDQLERVGAVLTEAGVNRVLGDQLVWWGIEVAQKRPLWLRLTVDGRGGHGSGYNPRSATHVLVRALDRLLGLAAETRPRLSEPAFLFFRSLTPFYGEAYRSIFDHETLEEAQAAIDRALDENRLHRSLLPGMTNHMLDTIQVTRIDNGSSSINVVPARATASIDIRLLPDTDEKLFLQRLRETVGEYVDVEVLLRSAPAAPPRLDETTYLRLSAFLQQSAPVVPTFIPGTTDSRYFRSRGIPAYGFSPFLLTGEDSRGIHATDEGIPVETYLDGVDRMVAAVRALTLP